MTRNKLADCVQEHWDDAVFVASVGCIAHGVSLIHASLGWIAIGVAGFRVLYLTATVNGHHNQSDEPARELDREPEPAVDGS